MTKIRMLCLAVAALVGIGLASGTAAAGPVYDFTQSNFTGTGNFGTIELKDNTTDGIGVGKVQFVITMNAGYTIWDFSINSTLTSAQLTGATVTANQAGFATVDIPAGQQDGFGTFDELFGADNHGAPEAVSSVTITLDFGVANASLADVDNFQDLSGGSGDLAPAYFAAHMVSNGNTGYVGTYGPEQPHAVPVPAGIVLLASGVPVLFLGRLLRRRKRVAA